MSKKQEKAKLVAARLAKREARATKPDPSYTNREAFLLSGRKHYKRVEVIRQESRGGFYRVRLKSGIERIVAAGQLFPDLNILLGIFELQKNIAMQIHNLNLQREHVFETVKRWSPEFAEERESNP